MMRKRLFIVSCLLVCLTVLLPLTASADNPPAKPQDDEPLLEQLRRLFKNDFMELGVLVQTHARYSPVRTSGFDVGTARFKVQGALDYGWGYKLQADVANAVALKDALIGYQANPTLGFKAGRYKAPFSYEELTSTAATDFIRRSRVVRALAPGRDIGTNVTATVGSITNLYAGIYNGSGSDLNSNNNRFLYTTRAEFFPTDIADFFVVGANAAYNNKPNNLGETLIGADFRLEQKAFLVAAEVIYGSDKRITDTRRPFGHHLTAGYTLPTSAFHQLLIRWDRFTPDTDFSASDHLVLGYSHTPTSVISFQADYVVPMDKAAFDNHRVLFELQIAL